MFAYAWNPPPRRNRGFDIAILESLRAGRPALLRRNLLWLSRLLSGSFHRFLDAANPVYAPRKRKKRRDKLTFNQNVRGALWVRVGQRGVSDKFISQRQKWDWIYANRPERLVCFILLSKCHMCVNHITHRDALWRCIKEVTIICTVIWWETLMVANKLYPCPIFSILFTSNLIFFVPGKLSTAENVLNQRMSCEYTFRKHHCQPI